MRVYVAGHNGLVGRALVRRLSRSPEYELITASRAELDLTHFSEVRRFLADARPEWVFLAAAKVGGIGANDRFSADFIRENLMIQTSVIDGAHRAGARKLLFLGSSCIYPKFATSPIGEGALMTGPLEPTNEAYAVAKIAGLTMARAYEKQFGMRFASLMPTNLYGPFDNFDPESSHVIPGLIRKLSEAARTGDKVVRLWGTGTPLREFLHVDDLARICEVAMRSEAHLDLINVGSGEEVTIAELARQIAGLVRFDGEIVFDSAYPDGTPRKRLDLSRMAALGVEAEIALRDGLAETVEWYLRHREGLVAP